MTLTEFLLQRIADDEAAARHVADLCQDSHFASIVRDHAELAAGDCPSWISDYDPARVLAECEAKRRIVEFYGDREVSVALSNEASAEVYAAESIERAMQFLAAVYADHPDFRDEWRP